MVDHLLVNEEIFLPYSRSLQTAHHHRSDMVTDEGVYQVLPSPFSEDELSDSSSSRCCSSPESQVLGSSCSSTSSSGESQDGLLDFLISQSTLSQTSSTTITPAMVPPVLPMGLAWESRRDRATKEECFEFPLFPGDLEDHSGLLFQPTLEEIEEFLEENMEVIALKEKANDGTLTSTIDQVSSPESQAQSLDQTVPVFRATADPETKCAHSSLGPTTDTQNGVKKEESSEKASVVENSGVPVILQIQPIQIKQEPAPNTAPTTQPPASDIKIAQLLVNIQGQTFALVPHVMPPASPSS
ncbi:hypothetical protein MHYP_G00079980, partial [Metynnis hypsauchen]